MRARGLLAILRQEFGPGVTAESFLKRVVRRLKPCARRRKYMFWGWRGNHQVRIHRAVATLTLGRDLRPGEHVHHLDGDKHNNRPGNLCVVRGTAEHRLLHGASGVSLSRKGAWVAGRYGTGPNRGRLVGRVVMERLLGRALRPGEVVVSVAEGGLPLPSRDLRVLPRGEHLAFYAMARRAGLKVAVAAWFPDRGLCGTRAQRRSQE